MNDIMDYFPYETPRKSQEYVLREVQDKWHYAEVFVIRVPVAGGKSAIAATIQDWCLRNGSSAAITVPNNMLRDQYMSEFDWLRTIKAQNEYWLDEYDCNLKQYMSRNKVKRGPKGCQYNEDKRLIGRGSTPIVTNFMSYQAHKLFRNVMIVDEAHQLLPTLQGIHATRLWRHTHRYPQTAKSVVDLLLWLEGIKEPSSHLRKLQKELTALTPSTMLQFTTDFLRGQERDCIKLLPIDVSEKPPIFWPPHKTRKLVLMSATINETDIDNMGLSTRKVHFIDAPSEIPEQQRPVFYTPIGSMSRRNRDKTIPALVRSIQEILTKNEGKKGLIHVTYELGEILREHLTDDRLIFHTQSNKREQYEYFLNSPGEEGKVFVGAGVAEGIDLKYVRGQFQIITKIPFKSLENPSFRYLARWSPKEYLWITSKDILQASGRICRTPDDYGATYILDSDFDIWYNRAVDYRQIPAWFNPITKGDL